MKELIWRFLDDFVILASSLLTQILRSKYGQNPSTNMKLPK